MHFPISFNSVSKVVLGVIGCGPRASGVEVDATTVHARLGWSGNVTIPRSSIVAAERVGTVPFWLGIGVHGWAGTWALNGSRTGVVRLTIDGPANGRTLIIPFSPKTLYVSLEDPEGFVSEVSPPLTR